MNAMPFACIRPTAQNAPLVAALPYDVYSRTEAAEAVHGRPLSFLNIDRPETQFEPGHDMYAPEVYARAAELFWGQVASGVYERVEAPCYHLYELAQDGRTQTGIVAACPIDDFDDGTIRRHELTRPDKERDRIAHISALGAQTGPIFLSYRDDAGLNAFVAEAKAGAPLYDFTDDEGCRQRVWEVAAPADVERVRALFAGVPRAYIADGHHRTASAVKVGRRMREEARAAGAYTGEEEFNRVLCVLFPASELAILPYNRVVADRAGRTAGELVEAVRAAGFAAETADAPFAPTRPGQIGMYTAGRWWRLTVLEAGTPADDPVAALDISILQERVLAPLLGIDDPRTDPRISFVGGVRGLSQLERDAGAAGVAFSMFATGISQLFDVADANLLMPPKSTWFEPKLRSGLFIHQIA